MLMSLPDEAMRDLLRAAHRAAGPEVDALLAGHPRAAKARLAREVTSRFHSPEAALAAAEEFDRVFRQGAAPEYHARAPSRARARPWPRSWSASVPRRRRAKPGAS